MNTHPSTFARAHCRPWHAVLVAMLFALTSMWAASADDPLALPRAQFQLAYARIAEVQPAPADSPALRRYMLYPYLQAARLTQALNSAGANVAGALDEQIATFVRAHESETVSQDLRRSWLASLAMRTRWQPFMAFHRETADGPALQCHRFNAAIQLQRTDNLAAQIRQAWLTPRSLPECELAFEWLRRNGALDDALIEQRARLALAAGNAAFARQIAAPLPVDRAAPLLQWAALLENPRREIDALLASPDTVVESRALLDAWSRLARADRTAATQRFEKLLRARRLDPRAASPFALALALPLAWDRNKDSLRYFARVEATDFDDTSREWQARAALWAHDWKQAAGSIAAMTEANQRTARWRYWAARLAAKAGENERARQLYESILAEDNYYSAMAAARLKRGIAPNPQALPQDTAQLARLGNLPPFQRASELRLQGLMNLAQAEWRAGMDAVEAAARPQAIHLAAGWGWFDQAIATATGERVFNAYVELYPRPYDAQVAGATRLTALPVDVVYGVIRQESLYRADAVSTANARGLMQLLPETARRTARQWQQPLASDAALFDPAINITLGAAHLKDLLERFGGQLPVALASYNAGPGAAQRWLPERTIDPDIWIENIPYNETRAYVQRILWHTVVFGWLREQKPRDTRDWLEGVKPAASGR